MSTFRKAKQPGDFVVVHKQFIMDEKLSWKAKGILLYLLSQPDDWQVYEVDVVKHSKDGGDSVSSGIKELIDTKYIIRTQLRNDEGKFGGYDYMVYEFPQQEEITDFQEDTGTGKTVSGKTDYRKTDSGKPATTNNNITNNKITNNKKDSLFPIKPEPTKDTLADEVINYLNDAAGTKYKSTTKETSQFIHGRNNEGYTLADFKYVVDVKVQEWKGTEMEQYLRPSTLFRPGNFEKYLNQKMKTEIKDGIDVTKHNEIKNTENTLAKEEDF